MKEYTMIADIQLTHIDTVTDLHSQEILGATDGLDGWKKYIAQKLRARMMDDIGLDADDVLVKSVQIFERDVPREV